MKRDSIMEYFLENRNLEGAPNLEQLTSLNQLQKGSIVYYSDNCRMELTRIKVEEFIDCLTKYQLIKGTFSSENIHSRFFTTFPKDSLTMPRHYLTITHKQVDQGNIYHTKPN